MAITNPRIRKQHAIAFAHQAPGNFGTPAATSGVLFFAQVEDIKIRRGTKYIDPQGTTGSEFPKDTEAEVATAPGATIRMYAGNRQTLALLQEHATHGTPTAIQASGDITKTGDGSGFMTAWTLAGVRPKANTDSGNVLYAKMEANTPGGGQGRVSLYSDSARTALVAQGSGSYSTTVSLAAQNNSGLTATVALGNPGGSSDLTGTSLTVTRTRAARAAQVANFFTLFRDTGPNGELETLTGCTIREMRLRSDEANAIAIELEILAGAYTKGSHDANVVAALTASDKEYFTHSKVTVTYNSVSESCFYLSHGLSHTIEQHLANAAAPVALVKYGSELLAAEFTMRLSDEALALIADGQAGTYRQLSADYLFGTKHWIWTYDRTKREDPDLAEYRSGNWEEARQRLTAREQSVSSPPDPLTITLDL